MSIQEERAFAVERVMSRHGVSVSGAWQFEGLLNCAHELIEGGLIGEAHRLLSIAFTDQQALSRSQQLRLSALLVRAQFMISDEANCLEVCRAALSLPAGDRVGEPRANTHLRIYEGAALYRLARTDEAIELLERLRRELLQLPDSVELAMCCHYLSCAHHANANWRAAVSYAQEAMVSASRSSSAYWLGLALIAKATTERVRGRFVAATDSSSEAVVVLRAAGSSYNYTAAQRTLGIALWRRGRLEAALQAVDDCLEVSVAAGFDVQTRYALLLAAGIEIHAGDFAKAHQRLEQTGGDWANAQAARFNLLHTEYYCDLLLEQGATERALAGYRTMLERVLWEQPTSDVAAGAKRRIGECLVVLGHPAEAVGNCEQSLDACRELGDRYEEAATYRVLAMAQAALGQHELARKAFDQGFTLYDEIETPYEWGKLWLAYGDWLVAESSGAYRNLSAAHEAYRVAIDHFEGMGAEYRLTQARARLEALDALVKNDGEELASPRAKVRPVRRPRHSAETLRKAQWVLETYGIVTRNRSMLDMLTELEAVAKSDLPVMVLGESGTGKELIAQGVHKLSGRVGRMVALNCSAIPASMLESEIFGHVKGAFTNAIVDKPGLFEVADGGTIFLDEIGEMAPDLQAKLLRVLELGVVRRIGGTDDIRVRSRVVAATNRDRSAMQNGQGFRSDLYYRLAHAVYELPGLRTRGDDIELLVEHFLGVFNREHGKTATLTPSARERLCDYPWPGNIRQLRAVIEKMVVAARPDGKLTPRDVPLEDAGKVPTGMMAELDAEEARRIRKALSDANGIKTAAAEILGISRTTLLGKMKRLGIE